MKCLYLLVRPVNRNSPANQFFGSRPAAGCVDPTFIEIAGGDDPALLIGARAAAYLLHYRKMDVIPEFPLLDLDSHSDAKNMPQCRRP